MTSERSIWILCLLLLAFTLGAKRNTVVRAERFELVDASGAVVAVWTTTPPTPRIVAPPPPAPEPTPDREPPVDPARRLILKVFPPTSHTAIEVTCASGFRERTPFVEGVATLRELPERDHCTAYFKGGSPVKARVAAGDVLSCRLIDGVSALCEPSGG